MSLTVGSADDDVILWSMGVDTLLLVIVKCEWWLLLRPLLDVRWKSDCSVDESTAAPPQYGLNEDDVGANVGVGPIVDQVVVSWRHIECHIDVKYGQEKLLPDNSISRMRVSIGVLPTKRTKNNCSITWWRIGEKWSHKIRTSNDTSKFIHTLH